MKPSRRSKLGTIQFSIVAVIAILVILALYIIYAGDRDAGAAGDDDSDGSDGTTTNTIYEKIFQKTSLSRAYHSQLDTMFPGYLDNRSGNCRIAGGTWYDSNTKVGCFNVPVWSYTSMCFSGETAYLRTVCNGIEQTTWVCDAHNVGCYY